MGFPVAFELVGRLALIYVEVERTGQILRYVKRGQIGLYGTDCGRRGRIRYAISGRGRLQINKWDEIQTLSPAVLKFTWRQASVSYIGIDKIQLKHKILIGR